MGCSLATPLVRLRARSPRQLMGRCRPLRQRTDGTITPFRNGDILTRLGDRALGIETPAQRTAPQLALHGLKPADIRYVLHTHLHIDHAG